MTPGQDPSAPDRPRLRRPYRRILLSLAAGCAALPVIAVAGLAVRLSLGPMDVTLPARLVLPVPVLSGGHGRPAALRLDIGQVRVGWDVLRGGLTAPLDVRAADMRLVRPDGVVADRIGTARMVLAGAPLLHGRVTPRVLEISAVRLALRRAANGSVGLDTGPFPVVDNGAAPLPVDPAQLDRLVVGDAAVTLRDVPTGGTWQGQDLAADLRAARQGGAFGGTVGLVGRAGVTLSGPGVHAMLRAEGQRADAAVSWHVSGTKVAMQALSPFAPALARVALPVGLDGTVRLVADRLGLLARPDTVALRVQAGAGRIATGRGGVVVLAGAQADLSARFGPAADGGDVPGAVHVRLDGLQASLLPSDHPDAPPDNLGPGGPVLRASGALDIDSLARPGRIGVTLAGDIPLLDFATLGAYWPAGAARGARTWVTRNITAGMAHDLHVTAGLASTAGWGAMRLLTLGGGVAGSDLDLHWLRPIPPIRGVDATLTFDGPDALSIAFTHGVQTVDRTGRNVDATGTGRIAVGDGHMRITGLMVKDQMGDISTTLHGNVRDVLALLAEPRLNLLSRHPLSFSHPSGRADLALHLVLPLNAHVRVDELHLDGHADLAQVHLGNVVLGRALEGGRLAIDATTDGLGLRGTGVLGGVPSTLRYDMDFRSDPGIRVRETAQLRAHVTPEVAERAGFAVAQRFSGAADLDVGYDRYADGTGQVRLDLDLDDAALTIPVWSKARGQAARASARIGLADGRLASVEAIHAAGPDLLIDGRANVAGGTARNLILRGFRVGRSRGDATIGVPAGPRDAVRVAIDAPVLDLSPLLAPDPAADHGTDPVPQGRAAAGYHLPVAASGRVHGPPGRSWLIDASVRTLFYAKQAALTGVHAHLEDNGVRLTRMRFAMAGPSPASAILTPESDGRHLWASVQDLGLMLRGLDVTTQFEGGRTVLQGVFDDRQPSAPFAGVLTIDPMTLHKAPGAVRLANDASIYGWMQAPKGPDFLIQRVSLPLTFRDGTLHIHDGVLNNASLGVTLEGPLDLDHGRMDLRGTIVPAFAVNTIPGHMPGVGRLMSPEKGGGLLAATFVVSGAMNAPALKVNPFSIFLPGVLRRLVQ
ncbi:hypothetical protein HLH33_08930 [Gluconacetobacter diazotrophicus]|uniref:AsmA-like C-terminal domain-containing protein n=1 Tax=Gluconacetobacter diazotrophicus TaxID=33996 RepID=A0A7W4FEX1_GLUDI|nr:AsmA-like C-terminal region-containing protein [Gluconacetobacter diazotrophicus]MBB2156432.1 hypothetical protein [Gluconacetobacter diazotrophicus]